MDNNYTLLYISIAIVAKLKCSSSLTKAHLHYYKILGRGIKNWIRQSFVWCLVCHVMVSPYRQRLVLIWVYYASSVLSASGESVIYTTITSCERSTPKLLHFGNLESRCGFSYDGLPGGLAYAGPSEAESEWKWCGDWDGIKCDVIVVLRFYVFPCCNLFRMLSDVGIMALPAFVAFVSKGSK